MALMLSGAVAEAAHGVRDPDTGPFLSPDPFGLVAGMNRYAFCGNNPVSIFDPDGRLGKNPVNGGITQVGSWLNPRIAGPHVLDLGDVGAEAAYFGLPHPDAGTSDILNLTPGIGMFKAFGEAITGSDLLTGESVDPFGRLASGGIQMAILMPARPVGPLRSSTVAESTTLAAGGSGNAFSRFFYDPRNFQREISPAYWASHGPANGRSLHHWFIPQRAKSVPEPIRNAGWNLVDLPAMEGVLHPRLGLNQWMGFARNWGPAYAWQAAAVENIIRGGIPITAGATAYGSYQLGEEIAKSLWGDE